MDAEKRATLFLSLAEKKLSDLGDIEGAANAFREVLDTAEDGSDLRARALESLVAVEEARGDFGALEEALLRQLQKAEGDAAQKTAVLFQLAQLSQDRLEDEDRAIDYVNQVLDIEPDNRAALSFLEKLFAKTERWPDVAEMIERRAEVEAAAGNTAAALAARSEAAKLLAQELDEPERALDNINAILEQDAGNVEALMVMAAIQTDAEDWDQALETLSRAAKSCAALADADEAAAQAQGAEILYRRAKVLDAQNSVDNADAIKTALMDVVDLNARHEGALNMVEPLLRQARDHGPLARVLERKAQLSQDMDEKAALLGEAKNSTKRPCKKPKRPWPSSSSCPRRGPMPWISRSSWRRPWPTSTGRRKPRSCCVVRRCSLSVGTKNGPWLRFWPKSGCWPKSAAS